MTVIFSITAFLTVGNLQQGGSVSGSLAAAETVLLGTGPIWLVLGVVLLLPAFVLTIELVHRSEATSSTARSLLGAVSWAGWGVFGAVTLALASRVTIVPEWLAGDLLLSAAMGAAFARLAFADHEVRSGRVLTLMAVAVAAFVVLGSLWMAGRWGAAA